MRVIGTRKKNDDDDDDDEAKEKPGRHLENLFEARSFFC